MYQGPISDGTKQQRFLGNYGEIVKLVRPLNGTTIFCRWDTQLVGYVYDQIKNIFGGSTVAATKTLYFFVPDLFIILDRAQVWHKWKEECRSFSILPWSIKDVNGREYVALLEHVGSKIASAIRGGVAFTLDGSPPSTVNTVDALRLVTPLRLDRSEKIGHTLGKVIDKMIAAVFPEARGQLQ
ncbi:hypothetical protein ACFLXE_00215 [Chloroflexota bacterium]